MAETVENKTVAYADESVLLSADPPLYLVGASLIKGDLASAIKALEQAKPKGAVKLH